jgi:hypothetical protein
MLQHVSVTVNGLPTTHAPDRPWPRDGEGNGSEREGQSPARHRCHRLTPVPAGPGLMAGHPLYNILSE